MKIRSIEIENYKAHKNTKIVHCSDLHSFVGRNSSGKTSLIELFEYIERFPAKLPGTEVIFGGIGPHDTKEIVLRLSVELDDAERREYLIHYFGIPEKRIDPLMSTQLLKYLNVEFKAIVSGERVPKSNDTYTFSLVGISYSGTKNNFLPAVEWGKRDRDIFVRSIEQDEPIFHDISPQNADDRLNSRFSGGRAVRIGQTLASENSFQGRFVSDLKESLKFIQSVRQSNKLVETKYVTDLSGGKNGALLVNLMETLFINDNPRFLEIASLCMRLFPDITKIRPERLPNNHIRIVIRKKNIPYDIDLALEGKGLDQLLIIIWFLASSKPGTIWFLDEPELHLHPGAQKLLYDFLKEESQRGKQIFVATHSMVFIHNSDLNEVSLLLDSRDYTESALLRDLIDAEKQSANLTLDLARQHVYQALGYDPLFAFEPKVVVMVEGTTDERILKNFARAFEKPLNDRVVRFLVVGDKRRVENFSPIIANGMSGKKCIIILDNDKESPEDLKKKVLAMEADYRRTVKFNQPLLKDDNFHLYPENVYSIEYYLLDASAICKAAGINNNETIGRIKSEIHTRMDSINKKETRPKDFLAHLWTDNGFGPYDEVGTPVRISENISKHHIQQFPELVALIETLTK